MTDNGGIIIAKLFLRKRFLFLFLALSFAEPSKNATELTTTTKTVAAVTPECGAQTVALKKFCFSINGTWFPTTTSCFKYYLTVFETWKNAHENCTSYAREVSGIRGRLAFIPNEAVYNIMKTVVIYGSWIALKPRNQLKTTGYNGTGNNFPYKSEYAFYEDDRISADLCWVPPTIHVEVTKRQSVFCINFYKVGRSSKVGRYFSRPCETTCRFTCEYVLDVTNSSSRDSEKCETVETTTITTTSTSAVEEISSTVPPLQQFTTGPLETFCNTRNDLIWSRSHAQCFTKRSFGSTTWKDAFCKCANMAPSGYRGRLPVIQNSDVFQLLWTNARKPTRKPDTFVHSPFWVGLRTESLVTFQNKIPIFSVNWKWYEGDKVIQKFVEFGKQRLPRGVAGAERCANVQRNKVFSAKRCHKQSSYFCEYVQGPKRVSTYCKSETTARQARASTMPITSLTRLLRTSTSSITSRKTIVGVTTNKIQPGTMGATLTSEQVRETSATNADQRSPAEYSRKTTTFIADGEKKTGAADQSPHTGYESETTTSSIAGKITTWATMDKVASTTAATTTTGSPTSSRPVFPMSEVEEVVAKVFQTLGCTFILGALSLTLGAFLLLKDFSYERFLHMNQEISLLIAHILIMTARDKTDMPGLCKLVAIILHLTFMAAFNFLMLEALQTYAIMTSVVIRGGYFNRRQFFVIGWGGPALIAGVSALLMHDNYISHFSCWLNFDSRVAFATTVPICVLFSAAFVMAEAASMGYYPKIPGYDKNQATAAVANQKALFLLLPLNLASWLSGAIAVHYANFAMYSLVSALNLSLGIAIFVFHSLGNPKVHALFKKVWSKFFSSGK